MMRRYAAEAYLAGKGFRMLGANAGFDEDQHAP